MNEIQIVNLADMKPKGSDKTYRQLNMEKTWSIPLDSLVKILRYNSESFEDHPHGMVLRVVRQGRDCDGTPLYWLGSMTAAEYAEQVAYLETVEIKDPSMPFLLKGTIARPMISGGHSEESLKVVALPHEIEEDD